jgi:hypothetical protein
MKRCGVIIFLLNAVVIWILLSAAFGPAGEPEGPEAAGRGVAAVLSVPFCLVEAGLLCAFVVSWTKSRKRPFTPPA